MAFEDLRTFFNPDLPLTINGKTYTISSPNAEHGIKIRALFADPDRVINDVEELAEVKALLGPAWDEMNADGVSYIEAMHAGRTALMYYGISPAVGETHWRHGLATPGNDLPPEPEQAATGARSSNPKKRAAAKKSARTGSTTRAQAPTE